MRIVHDMPLPLAMNDALSLSRCDLRAAGRKTTGTFSDVQKLTEIAGASVQLFFHGRRRGRGPTFQCGLDPCLPCNFSRRCPVDQKHRLLYLVIFFELCTSCPGLYPSHHKGAHYIKEARTPINFLTRSDSHAIASLSFSLTPHSQLKLQQYLALHTSTYAHINHVDQGSRRQGRQRCHDGAACSCQGGQEHGVSPPDASDQDGARGDVRQHLFPFKGSY